MESPDEKVIEIINHSPSNTSSESEDDMSSSECLSDESSSIETKPPSKPQSGNLFKQCTKVQPPAETSSATSEKLDSNKCHKESDLQSKEGKSCGPQSNNDSKIERSEDNDKVEISDPITSCNKAAEIPNICIKVK